MNEKHFYGVSCSHPTKASSTAALQSAWAGTNRAALCASLKALVGEERYNETIRAIYADFPAEDVKLDRLTAAIDAATIAKIKARVMARISAEQDDPDREWLDVEVEAEPVDPDPRRDYAVQ